jgi:hypothetical protein
MYNPMNDPNTRTGRQVKLVAGEYEVLIGTYGDSEIELNNTYELPLSARLRPFLNRSNPAEIELVITGGEPIRKHLEPTDRNLREAADLLILKGILISAEQVMANPSRPEAFREGEFSVIIDSIRTLHERLSAAITDTLSVRSQ